MDLLRDWRRRTLGAAAGAIVAPVAIVLAALTVGIGGGGLGGLQSIGQAVTGPAAPPVAPQGERDRGTADEAGRLLARVRPERRRADATAAARDSTSAAGAPAGSPATQAPAAPAPGRRQTPTTAPPPAATPAPTPATPPAAPPSPAPTPGPVRQVGNLVTGITDQVPVVGQPVGQVVDLLVDTVEALPGSR